VLINWSPVPFFERYLERHVVLIEIFTEQNQSVSGLVGAGTLLIFHTLRKDIVAYVLRQDGYSPGALVRPCTPPLVFIQYLYIVNRTGNKIVK